MSNTEVVICSPVRTAIGTYGGTLKDMPAADVGAAAIPATLERSKLTGGGRWSVIVTKSGRRMRAFRRSLMSA